MLMSNSDVSLNDSETTYPVNVNVLVPDESLSIILNKTVCVPFELSVQ